jgi:nicotinate phosphoribosyltransferase
MPQLPISDEYFNRSAAIAANTPLYTERVRYCVFAREGGVVCGVNHAVAWIEQQCLGPLTIRARWDGDRFAATEAVMTIEGLFGELVNLETTYLGMLAFSGAATHMARIVAAAGDIPVIDMAARHYPYEIIEQTAYAAAVGGARGTSTRAGQRYVLRWLGTGKGEWIRVGDESPREFKVYGTIPHCLNAVMDGSSVAAAKAYAERFPDIPLTVLIDFEGRELDVCREAAQAFGKKLAAVRIDTHGARLHQGGHAQPVPELVERIMGVAEDQTAAREGLERHGFGPGVTIESAYNVRRVLDEVGARHTKVVVSSGFTAEKVAAFRACRAPMDAIGTGSWVEFLMFTSDITHVFENGRWVERSKAGRAGEISVPDMEVRVRRL